MIIIADDNYTLMTTEHWEEVRSVGDNPARRPAYNETLTVLATASNDERNTSNRPGKYCLQSGVIPSSYSWQQISFARLGLAVQ